MKKFLCTTLLLSISMASLLTIGVKASANYGSQVTRNAVKTYGYAWTESSGDICRTRIVIMGQTSDITGPSRAQTNQVSGASGNYAYMNYYVNGSLIASETK